MTLSLNFRFRDLFPDTPPAVILDIGAGDHPDYPAGLGPFERLSETGDAVLVGFEGDTRTFGALKAKETPNRRYLNYFVGDGRDRTFYATNNVFTGSLYRPNRTLIDSFGGLGEIMQVVEEIPVKTVRLDDIAELTDVDAIKIDVQGAELDVFRGAERLLGGVMTIISEVEFVPLYEDQPLFGDVDAFLRGKGFLLHHLPPCQGRMIAPVRSSNPAVGGSQSMWSDAIFTRDFRSFPDLPVEKLWKLAAILHDALRFFDFVSRILHVLDQRTGSTALTAYAERVQGG